MAYSPIEQGRLLPNPVLTAVADRHGATPAQVALAWLMTRDGVNVIPRTSTEQHVLENRAAIEITLTEQDLRALDAAFPPPRTAQRLQMI